MNNSNKLPKNTKFAIMLATSVKDLSYKFVQKVCNLRTLVPDNSHKCVIQKIIGNLPIFGLKRTNKGSENHRVSKNCELYN